MPNEAKDAILDLNIEPYRLPQGTPAGLSARPTLIDAPYRSSMVYEAQLQNHIRRLIKAQGQLYASNLYAILIIIQGMDAAGKDGTILHVLSGINPESCDVYNFRQPSATELRHDFLWRSNQVLPERGKIAIFNRSYYEEVLIIRVHPEMLVAEGLTEDASALANVWRKRYRSINALEQHLYESRTRIIKIFLHLSANEQTRRFLDRVDTPVKNWKLSKTDMEERKFWPDYEIAYEECLSATSTAEAPWYVVPADDKGAARLIVSQIIVNTLEELKLPFPMATVERRVELQSMRAQLEAGQAGDAH